jgi:two-component sensor histidine kinase
MALIHENLYNNDTLANIKFSNYVSSLTGNIARTFANQKASVRFDYKMEDAYLPIDAAIPCGLIINELISNSFKYAFKGKDQGTISIIFKRLNTEEYQLEVADDGIGIPNDVDITKTKSLGMKIIHKLIKQIDGELSTDFSEGTKFIITFKTL